MKRLKTRVLIASAADARKAARALLACLRRIDVKAFEELLIEHESLAGVPANGRLRDDLLPRLEEAIAEALPPGYYLSFEKVRRTGPAGYVLRREGEEELDDDDGGDMVTAPGRTPLDVTRAIERNAAKLASGRDRRRARGARARSAESHHARGESERTVFRANADELARILSEWVKPGGWETQDVSWRPRTADVLAGKRLVDDAFRGTFDMLCREALSYALRFIVPGEAEEIAFFVVYNAWRDSRGAARRAINPSAASRAVVESAVRRMGVTHWQWRTQWRPDPDPHPYLQLSEAFDVPDTVVRRTFHEMLVKLRAVFDSPLEEVHDADLRAPVPGVVHPDFARLGDLLAGALSPSDALLLVTRLRNDADAFERMWPLVEAWESVFFYSAVRRIAGLFGGRLSGRYRSVSRTPRQVNRLDDDHTLERLWTAFLARVGHGARKELDESRLFAATRKDWRAAIAQHGGTP